MPASFAACRTLCVNDSSSGPHPSPSNSGVHTPSGRSSMSNLSLKGFIPELAKAVGMTPAALYERQRALVRAGLLHGESGRGPGSGVRATPESVAMLLIALLATDSLSETESEAKVVTNLKSGTKPCPLTGKKTFASALASALG